MAQCPKCGANLKEEYGMSHCGACKTISFIDMDGNAFVQTGDQSEEQPDEHLVGQSPEQLPEQRSEHLSEEIPAPSHREEAVGYSAVPANDSDVVATAMSPIPAIDPSEFAPPAEAEHASEYRSFDHMPEPMIEQTSSVQDAGAPAFGLDGGPDFGPKDDPLGIVDFANSEMSSAKDGPLVFRVLISGIDSKEIREIIREVIEDSRFGWDVAEVMSKLKKGILVIDNLQPVKASILVTRIKRLPVKIQWEQYAISQSSPT